MNDPTDDLRVEGRRLADDLADIRAERGAKYVYLVGLHELIDEGTGGELVRLVDRIRVDVEREGRMLAEEREAEAETRKSLDDDTLYEALYGATEAGHSDVDVEG